MKLQYLGLIFALGMTASVCPSASVSKSTHKRKSSSPLEGATDAKKPRTVDQEFQTKAAAAELQQKSVAADNSDLDGDASMKPAAISDECLELFNYLRHHHYRSQIKKDQELPKIVLDHEKPIERDCECKKCFDARAMNHIQLVWEI